MKIIKILSKSALVAAAGLMTIGCTGDFAEQNTNPKSLTSVAPQALFYTAEMQSMTSGHAWNAWASMQRWNRHVIGQWSYNDVRNYQYFTGGIGNEVYNEYNRMGGFVTNIEYLAGNLENAASYSTLHAMGRIMLIAKGIQASDMWGSLAYSDAWQTRNGETDESNLRPKFQTQEELSTIWDTELKAAIETLKTASGQIEIKGYDRAYNGDASKWIKAANAIRLRLATRLLKRKPDVAKTIATEVLASGNGQYVMNGTADSFILWFDNLYTNVTGGDWHSGIDLASASRTFINYLKENEDPRMRMMFRKNNLTPEVIAAYNAWLMNPAAAPEGGVAASEYDSKLPVDSPDQPVAFRARYIPEGYGPWEGGTNNPDARATDPAALTRSFPANSKNPTAIAVRPSNNIQIRLWKGNHDNGSGGNWTPVMTHADFCFLAAEFVLTEGVTSAKTAQQWYEEGVKSSLDQWNEIGKYCAVYDYTAMTEAEISTFLSKPDIKWGSGQAFQLEQIRTQSWVDNYKNIDEAWAQWKRTNVPGVETTIVTFERVYYNGSEMQNPRRARISEPATGVQNFDNLKERVDVMKQNPEFGDPSVEYGRHWWDKL